MAIQLPSMHAGPYGQADDPAPESLFERFPWLYAFCRERLFRDDTDRIAATLWPAGIAPAGQTLLELGCGPGFYARRLAARFAHLQVLGIDRAEQQVRRARTRAAARRLTNCRFVAADACAVPWPAGTFDAVIASRLFTILPAPERALAEMHRVLRPGGRCFIAEPRSALRVALPLRAMWLLAGLMALFGGASRHAYREPGKATVLDAEEFDTLIASQPWARVWRWRDASYQYALCEKCTGDSHRGEDKQPEIRHQPGRVVSPLQGDAA
jgi:arsenite methyltransferase